MEAGVRRRGCGPPPITRSSRSWTGGKRLSAASISTSVAGTTAGTASRRTQTWHDISALIDGPAAEDAARQFGRLWNRELPRYREIVAEWTGLAAAQADARSADGSPRSGRPVEDGTPRCSSSDAFQRSPPLRGRPRHCIRELKARTEASSAPRGASLYIEAQFFRSKDAATGSTGAEGQSELEVIILIAKCPEECAFEGQTGQSRASPRRASPGARPRASAPPRGPAAGRSLHARQAGVGRMEREEVRGDQGTAFGSGLIHIHSKLLIADDDVCLLSSANINGRSFEWDTELGFIWSQKGDAIGEFRRRLWWQLFGGSLPEQLNLDGWRDAARFNSGAEPEERKGFILPYQLGRARRFSRPYWFIPDDLV
jgi:phospholipase D1/2